MIIETQSKVQTQSKVHDSPMGVERVALLGLGLAVIVTLIVELLFLILTGHILAPLQSRLAPL